MGVIDRSEPWDDPQLLDELHNHRDMSTREIAHDYFDGDVSHEHIRQLLHEYELINPDKSDYFRCQRLLDADPEVDLTRQRRDLSG